MKKKIIVCIVSLAWFVAGGCIRSASSGKEEEKDFDARHKGELALTSLNASQYGVQYPETFILMQNRMGIRSELCLDRSVLQLWISPQAGKSMSYVDKNWSNRDDHTCVFDRIRLPGLNNLNFVRCDYDPFYSKIYFEQQTLHILNIYDQPAIVLWFEKDGNIDFKSAAGDEAVERSSGSFVIHHTDRGRTFEYAAILGPGSGSFRHQYDLDEGRSIYARAELKAGQLVVIAGELTKEKISRVAASLANTPAANLIAANENKITQALAFGQVHLKNRPEMQKLLDINKRIALSMQDEKGFMRSTNQYIYYLLWYRDGGMNTSHLALTGWLTPALWQADFALQNPNISNQEPKGIFYGQVMAGPITKWEEDGLFYVVWPAFTYWTLSGDDRFCKGKYMETMKKAMDWLEKYCYDNEKGLFGRYYYCETPLSGSRDDGWDNAVGRPEDYHLSRYHQSDTIVTRSYDIYINALNYAVYLMMASMTEGPEYATYVEKAERLERNMMKWYEKANPLPLYGDMQTRDHREITIPAYGMDITDYQWALSVPPFTPTLPVHYKKALRALHRDLSNKKLTHFICSYAAILTAMDNELFDEDSIMASLDYLVPQSVRPGKYLPMPYTIPEIVDMVDGNPYHDVRPLVYSIAPWLSAVSGRGVRKLPFGIAVRATRSLSGIDNYQYLDGTIDFSFTGEGNIKNILVNGEKIEGTWQLPDEKIKKGDNNIVVEMDPSVRPGDVLISSSVRLISASPGKYLIRAYAKNVLVFKNLSKQVIINDKNGTPVPFTTQQADHLTYVEFKGKGLYEVNLK